MTDERPEMTPSVDSKKATAAAKDLIALLTKSYTDARGVHAETVIGAAASLAGAYTLRAAVPLQPGTQWVLSSEAVELICQGGPVGKPLADIILQSAQKQARARDWRPDIVAMRARASAAIGSSPYPPLSVPAQHYPREWSPNATVRLRPQVDRLMAEKSLNPHEAALALTLATGELIAMTATTLDPRIAATLALEIMIGVSYMRPLAHEFGSRPGQTATG